MVMKALVAIDPGNVTGFALFLPVRDTASGTVRFDLHECGITKERYLPTDGPFRVAIERPQADDRKTKGGKPVPLSDKLTLAWKAGILAGWYEALGHAVAGIEPRLWKASLTKEQCWELVRSRLSGSELELVFGACQAIAPSYVHNMHDAIGIGMAVLGRFKVRP